MRISVVKEIKPQEERVGLAPAGAAELVRSGHTVYVETGAGVAAGYTDVQYSSAGAKLVSQAQAWNSAELLVKVKEPIEAEYGFLRPDLVLFAYLHLAADRPLTEALLEAGTLAIAYETVQDDSGLPLLTPMSEIPAVWPPTRPQHIWPVTPVVPDCCWAARPEWPPAACW
jgi:alanine dehydrogenase